MSLSNLIRFVDIVLNNYYATQLNNSKNEFSAIRKDTAIYEEQIELMKSRHIGLDFIENMASVLKQDHSYYTMLFDAPYEPWSNKYHTGNIQHTMVSAWWKSDDNRGIIA